MKLVHKVCTYMKGWEQLWGNHKKVKPRSELCKQCPAVIDLKNGHGKAVLGCYHLAQEVISMVKYGQPWGKKYQHSRASWPNRAGYKK